MIKHIMIVRKKAGISSEEFYRYWKDVHGPFVAKHIPGLKKYVQNHFVKVPGFEYEGDGIVENYYDDLTALKKSLAFNNTPEERKLGLLADWAKIADLAEPKMWIVQEHVILDKISGTK
jgi:uncharacterized protein (TIGR02118 family)